MAMWNTYIWVDSADDAAAKAREAGGAVLAEPFDVMSSGRMAVLADPEGAVFNVWQAQDHKGSQVVNEHGALNFNGLATRDPESAARSTGRSSAGRRCRCRLAPMWTLPGYGDHLEEGNPGLREQVAQMGGPEGSSTSSRRMNPIGDEQPDARPTGV